MSSLQVGGGEIVQNIWFDLKALGVKNSAIMQGLVAAIGTVIQKPETLVSEEENVFAQMVNNNYLTNNIDVTQFKLDYHQVFIDAFNNIKLFLTTNMPSLMIPGARFSLSFNGSSLLVALVK